MKTWFITGTSSGFGRQWTAAALERGDRVVATSRDAAALDDLVERHGDALLPLSLRVTDRAAVLDAVRQAHERFGRLDVVVNNAGYGTNGMIEEVSEQDVRDQFETNVYGPLWVAQAVLPLLREQGSGHIIQVSSVGGIASFPGLGLYCASKFALEGFSQALAAEVAGFGIKLTMIEPGGFDTGGAGSARDSQPLAAYEEFRAAAREMAASRRSVLGDPEASVAALMAIVEADEPPLRVFFGSAPLGMAEAEYERRLATWREWQHLSELAQGTTAPA
ncbi:MAG: SDR family oxidoreductase [Patulibacter sp.]|nr:SDR family oxidoreductase [Patulibacter sp.]